MVSVSHVLFVLVEGNHHGLEEQMRLAEELNDDCLHDENDYCNLQEY